jgi:hypothetical protein
MFFNKEKSKQIDVIKSLTTNVSDLVNMMQSIIPRLEALEQKIGELEAKPSPNTIEKFIDSEDPFVQVTGTSIAKDGGVNITMDWNAAFIQTLKESGYMGTDDDIIVQKWLVHLANDINNRMVNDQSEYH